MERAHDMAFDCLLRKGAINPDSNKDLLASEL